MPIGKSLQACLRRLIGVETCADETPADPCGDTGLAGRVKAPDRYAASRWGVKEWWNFLLLGRRPEPLPSFSGLIEPAEEGRIGIACSGGGIRSASFNLGALQALQEKGVLKKSRYLAAVSGGAYIAAAFCMVRKTWTPGEPKPPESDDSDPSVVNDDYPPFFSGSPEQQYLLNRSSYLAPDGKGKAAFGLRLVLGLGFNVLVLALFISLVAILLGALYGVLYPSLDQTIARCGNSCDFSIRPLPATIWISIVGVAVAGVVLGAAGMLAFRWSGGLRDFASTWALRLVVLATVAAVALIAIPLLLEWFRGLGLPHEQKEVEPKEAAKVTGIWGLLIGSGSVTSVLGALFLQLRADLLEVKKRAAQATSAVKWYSNLGQRLRRGIAYLIAALVGPALALALALIVMSTTLNIEEPTQVWIYFGILAVPFWIVYAYADLTTWSLHPIYRRRLASAFALKRVAAPEGTPPIAAVDLDKKGNRVAGAGIAVERDYDRLVKLSESAVIDRDADGECMWPTLLVCAAANVSDTAATPAGRAVSSFTFSATSIGGPLVGAVETRDLESSCDPDRLSTTFTLPSAVAISGAAISPSMGKMTRRPLRLLMGIANIRLGVWVPNPRRLTTFQKREKHYPRPRPYYLLRELLGLNQLNLPFLYVSDGGHYENLGAMELLRRGCTEIYCFDASKDELDALGDMISLARSELNVEVEIDPEDLRPDDDGISKKDCVKGTIRYPDGVEGHIYYARPAVTEKAPADVTVYHRQDKRFPRDPTGDQLYTGQRFEAYRALGLRAGHSAIKAAKPEKDSATVVPIV